MCAILCLCTKSTCANSPKAISSLTLARFFAYFSNFKKIASSIFLQITYTNYRIYKSIYRTYRPIRVPRVTCLRRIDSFELLKLLKRLASSLCVLLRESCSRVRFFFLLVFSLPLSCLLAALPRQLQRVM